MMRFHEEDDDAGPVVAYAEPWPDRWINTLKCAFVTLMVCGIVAGVFWTLLGHVMWTNVTPWWWHVLGVLALLATLGILFRLFAPHINRRLEIREDGLWVRGMVVDKHIAFEDVALLRTTEVRGTVGTNLRLTIEVRGSKPASLVLSPSMAEECVDVLHDFCERAGAITHSGQVRLPRDEAWARSTHFRASRTFRAHGWGHVFASALAACFTCYVVAQILKGHGSFTCYFGAVCAPALSVLFGLSAKYSFSAAKRHASSLLAAVED